MKSRLRKKLAITVRRVKMSLTFYTRDYQPKCFGNFGKLEPFFSKNKIVANTAILLLARASHILVYSKVKIILSL
jgi:hypothetical protein